MRGPPTDVPCDTCTDEQANWWIFCNVYCISPNVGRYYGLVTGPPPPAMEAMEAVEAEATMEAMEAAATERF